LYGLLSVINLISLGGENMATTVTNQGSAGNGMGNVLAIVVVIAFLVVLMYFGLPLLRGGNTGGSMQLPSTVNVNTK
jgi:hypothetical protein